MSKFTDGQRVRVTALNGRAAELTIFEDGGMFSVSGDKRVLWLLFGRETGSYPVNGKQIVSVEPVQQYEAQQPMLGGIL